MDSEKPLKPVAVQVWEELQELLKHESSPYLDLEKFVLQKDAYVRLSDPDVEADVPFLSYSYDEITHDEALNFSVNLYRYGFDLNMGPTSMEIPFGVFAFDSTQLRTLGEADLEAADMKVVAANLLLTVKYLLNGQIALGCTFNNERLLAVETFRRRSQAVSRCYLGRFFALSPYGPRLPGKGQQAATGAAKGAAGLPPATTRNRGQARAPGPGGE